MLNVDPQDMRESRGLKTFKIKDVISPHHGKMAEAIRPKICIEIHLEPEMVYGSVFLDSIEIIIVKMSSFIKISNFFFQP